MLFIVFDDVEYAELAFRDAHNLVMYYRQQGQLTKEPVRNRKRTDNQRLKKFGLSSDRSKQNHRSHSSFAIRNNQNKRNYTF
jgi:hypothetical protein